MEEQTYLVFVYGTLKKGEPNHSFMSSSTFVSEATTCEKFPLVIASKFNIPFLLNKPGVGHVKLLIASSKISFNDEIL